MTHLKKKIIAAKVRRPAYTDKIDTQTYQSTDTSVKDGSEKMISNQ